jgi:hypothetical protein
MGLFSKSAPLPEAPPFGALPAAQIATHFAKHLKAHSHLFPSETGVAWESVRGWDVNEEPPSLDARGMSNQAILTDHLIHFCDGSKGKLKCVFDFLLHMIEGIEFEAQAAVSNAPPGTGLLQIFTPSGRTLLVCSKGFAAELERTIATAKAWAEQHGMDVA